MVLVCFLLCLCVCARAHVVRIAGDIAFEMNFKVEDNVDSLFLRSKQMNQHHDSRHEDEDSCIDSNNLVDINDLTDTGDREDTTLTDINDLADRNDYGDKAVDKGVTRGRLISGEQNTRARASMHEHRNDNRTSRQNKLKIHLSSPHRSRHTTAENRMPYRHRTKRIYSRRTTEETTPTLSIEDIHILNETSHEETTSSRDKTENSHQSIHTINELRHSRPTREKTHTPKHATSFPHRSYQTTQDEAVSPKHNTHNSAHTTGNTRNSNLTSINTTDHTYSSKHAPESTHHTRTTTMKSLSRSNNSINSNVSNDECKYKPPQNKHIYILLSDMMNQITKVFVRLQQVKSTPDPDAPADSLIHHDSRFKLVHKKKTEFFDDIFIAMINEFMNVCNNTLSSSSEALSMPCDHQEQVRAVWSRLLDAAARVYWRAARMCVKASPYNGVERVRLRSHLKKARPGLRHQLKDRLCDSYRLCYPDL